MKLPATLCFALFISATLSGQIIIQQSDMPGPGDTIRRSNTLNLGYIDVEDTGPDHAWDFSALSPLLQAVDTFVAVDETPFMYQLFFFLTANMARMEPGFDLIPGFQVTDAYTFYRNTSSSYREVGFGVTFNGIPLPTLYDDPDLVYQFPLTEGSVDSSSSSYSFSIPGIGYIGGWRKRANTVDGWGTLTTPYGTFETLRVKTELEQNDSVYIDSLGMGIPVNRETTAYKWLATGMGLPLCEVVDNGITQTVSYIDSVRNILSVSAPALDHRRLRIWPNPAAGYVTIAGPLVAESDWSLQLMDQAGRPVLSASGPPAPDPLKIGLRNKGLVPGFYVLKLRAGKEEVVEKLIIR